MILADATTAEVIGSIVSTIGAVIIAWISHRTYKKHRSTPPPPCEHESEKRSKRKP